MLTKWILLLILALPIVYAVVVAVRRWIKMILAETQREWRRVPPPEWAAKRGGRDYW
jgi:hypothetical protein